MSSREDDHSGDSAFYRGDTTWESSVVISGTEFFARFRPGSPVEWQEARTLDAAKWKFYWDGRCGAKSEAR